MYVDWSRPTFIWDSGAYIFTYDVRGNLRMKALLRDTIYWLFKPRGRVTPRWGIWCTENALGEYHFFISWGVNGGLYLRPIGSFF